MPQARRTKEGILYPAHRVRIKRTIFDEVAEIVGRRRVSALAQSLLLRKVNRLRAERRLPPFVEQEKSLW